PDRITQAQPCPVIFNYKSRLTLLASASFCFTLMKTQGLLFAASVAVAVTSVFGEPWLWPIPQTVAWGSTVLKIEDHVSFNGFDTSLLQGARDRYENLIKSERWIPVQVSYNVSHLDPGGYLDAINLDVGSHDASLGLLVDESYSIDISASTKHALIKAKTPIGALRALETFSQLVFRGEDDHLEVQTVHIEDYPAYPHRGVLLDTSRNFYPVKHILRTIDALAYNKFNVFHWHITDSQSFPLGSKKLPELSLKGAYSKSMIYSPYDIKYIIHYAEQRGVRVIPEIDAPAHSASWGKAFPEITVCTDNFWDPGSWADRFSSEPTPGQLDPTNPKTFEIIQTLFKEVAETFIDEYQHVGGDEIAPNCWNSSSKIQEYAARHNVTLHDLLVSFEEKIIELVKGNNKKVIMWEDMVTSEMINIPKDVILQIWTSAIVSVVKLGYKVIASSSDFWYLDCGFGGWVGNDGRYVVQENPDPNNPNFNYGGEFCFLIVRQRNHDPRQDFNFHRKIQCSPVGNGGSWCAPYKTWQRVYSYDLTYNLTTADEKKQVLGGEVALWSEQADWTNLDSRLWPRAAAAAEVLWSGNFDADGVKRTLANAQPRMMDWRYRLVARGILADPIQPLWCAKNPKQCDAQLD
ncbi:glycoside hydrolase superfamily, partial [Endogone sp. FLAS-F59071]